MILGTGWPCACPATRGQPRGLPVQPTSFLENYNHLLTNRFGLARSGLPDYLTPRLSCGRDFVKLRLL